MDYRGKWPNYGRTSTNITTRKMKIGICVGHSRPGDQGATNIHGISEWTYWEPIAQSVADKVRWLGHQAEVFDVYRGSSYGAAMRDVAGQLKHSGCDVAVELHFNAATPQAEGYEFLYWHTSSNGALLAGDFLHAFRDAFPERRSRGIKPRDSGDRGSGFLQKTHCPAIIAEPFFGTNTKEVLFFNDRIDQLADALARGADAYLKR